ncbi:MAG TPA: CpsD/CapB family tyrosine-protein kinase [Pyrinomonadaceae bacterium]|nr:CpsD/CapB family tyrosine-protein kinase [Pyrinomonadaceae bacterium]
MEFYLDLIRNVFQAVDESGKVRNRVVGFTSSTPGEGVTYVVNTLAREIATTTQKRVLAVDSHGLQNILAADPHSVSRQCFETQIDNLLTLPATTNGLVEMPAALRSSLWQGDPEYRLSCIKALRWNFDYVLIDCSSLKVSADAAILAPIVDGVAVVVEAGRTRREEITRTKAVIEQAGGEFLGFVLNQRRYPVPGWLYRRL